MERARTSLFAITEYFYWVNYSYRNEQSLSLIQNDAFAALHTFFYQKIALCMDSTVAYLPRNLQTIFTIEKSFYWQKDDNIFGNMKHNYFYQWPI